MSEKQASGEGAMGNASQAGRAIAIDTPLGDDYLLLTSVSGDESISELFSYDAEMLSLDLDIKPERIIGLNVRIRLLTETGDYRPINGVVAEWRAGPLMIYKFRVYRARIVPWFWFLTQTTDCRIFQNLSVPDIIEEVFKDFAFDKYQISVTRADYPRNDYVVQYRESAFNFLARLMEHVGIFWFFRHSASEHDLVIADKNATFADLPDRVLHYESEDQSSTGIVVGHIVAWEHKFGFRPGRWSQRDFDFEHPATDLLTAEPTILKLRDGPRFERYDYPGGYVKKDLGGKLTRTLMETEESAYHSIDGKGSYAYLDTGCKFSLSGHPCEDEKLQYVVRSVHHEATDYSHIANRTGSARYENRFVAIPYDVQFRPLRVTRCPFVHGPQTAIVVGPPGEAIYTDQHGRVRVQFHWDRYGKNDDKSSCWIRVSQGWAGSGWGNVNLPHVGHEVVVSFLEGDPDRPLITGRVYNGDKRTAMGMPANKTQSAIRDHSGNEIVMEGKAGSEDIRINATKDTNVTIKHDYNETVKTGNRTIDIQTGTHTETIKGDTTIRVTSGKLVHRVEAKTAEYFVADDVKETFNKNMTTIVKNDVKLFSTDSKIFATAAEAIQLTTGASQLTMKKDGTITLIGKNIRVLGSESVKIGGDSIGVQGGNETKVGVGGNNTAYDKSKVLTSGIDITTNASGEHNIAGAIVKIN